MIAIGILVSQITCDDEHDRRIQALSLVSYRYIADRSCNASPSFQWRRPNGPGEQNPGAYKDKALETIFKGSNQSIDHVCKYHKSDQELAHLLTPDR